MPLLSPKAKVLGLIVLELAVISFVIRNWAANHANYKQWRADSPYEALDASNSTYNLTAENINYETSRSSTGTTTLNQTRSYSLPSQSDTVIISRDALIEVDANGTALGPFSTATTSSSQAITQRYWRIRDNYTFECNDYSFVGGQVWMGLLEENGKSKDDDSAALSNPTLQGIAVFMLFLGNLIMVLFSAVVLFLLIQPVLSGSGSYYSDHEHAGYLEALRSMHRIKGVTPAENASNACCCGQFFARMSLMTWHFFVEKYTTVMYLPLEAVQFSDFCAEPTSSVMNLKLVAGLNIAAMIYTIMLLIFLIVPRCLKGSDWEGLGRCVAYIYMPLLLIGLALICIVAYCFLFAALVLGVVHTTAPSTILLLIAPGVVTAASEILNHVRAEGESSSNNCDV